MSLTPEQRTALAADIAANAATINGVAISTLPHTADNAFAVALWYSQFVSPDYTGGFAGAGRKTATVTSQQNNTNNERDWAIADLTWNTLGGAVNNTLGGCAVVWENTNDAGSTPIAFLDFTDFTTNGSDVTLSFLALASRGNLRIAA